MSKKRNYYTASKKSKIALAVIDGKLTQAQLTSEYGVHFKAWKQMALQAISDSFTIKYDGIFEGYTRTCFYGFGTHAGMSM
jgi:transposase